MKSKLERIEFVLKCKVAPKRGQEIHHNGKRYIVGWVEKMHYGALVGACRIV